MKVLRRICIGFIRWAALWAPLFMLGILSILSAWLLNQYLVTLQDLALPLILCFILTAILAGIFYPFYKKDKLSGYIAAILSTLILTGNFEARMDPISPLFSSLNPLQNQLGVWQGVIFGLIFGGIVVCLSLVVGNAVSRLVTRLNWRSKDIVGGITILIGVTFLLQVIPTVRLIIIEWPQYFYTPPALAQGAAITATTEKPDIYYIVPDRYTSPSVLQTQFGYDNSDFTNFLEQQGFNVPSDGHGNFPYTTMSIASTLNADYNNDAIARFANASQQTVEPYHDSIRNGAVIQQLKSLGYNYTLVGSWYEASNESPLADTTYQPEGKLTVLGHTFTLNTFSKNQLTQSFLWRIINKGLSIGNFTFLGYSGITESDATLYKLQTLKTLAAQPSGGRFIFAHLLVPHDPYYFNADGSLNPNNGNDNTGEPIKEKYVNQVKFVNSQLEQLVTEINQNTNGKAVIIIQSDEGPYPMFLNDQTFNGNTVGDELSTQSMLDWSDQNLKMKFGVMEAYHIPAASTEALAQGGDNQNIFRVVLDSYFNAHLPYLSRCFYAYPDGRNESFVYKDITQRLTGQANPVCAPNGTGP